jgi:hypothetical protein
MKYNNIREEELKNKVATDWFAGFDTTQIIGNIDFSLFPEKDNIFHTIPLLWAEAKTGNYDTITMFVQLVLTIGKARTYSRMLPPAFLGAFDFQKFAFVPYNSIEDIFSINDFNWNVTPSNHETKEFTLIRQRIEDNLKKDAYIFDFEKDAKELRFFISHNLINATDKAKQTINKSNFVSIYLRWLEVIKPIIDVKWENLKKRNILDCDFFLADLFVDDKGTPEIIDDTAIYENLFVFFENQGYTIRKENLRNQDGSESNFDAFIRITDRETYQNFWKLYKRPPHSDYHDYIIERRELLVPQDIRERKGAFFTPRQWVALSQQYLTDYLGDNWQDEYYIWDCAAGTGNLLAGLTNKYNIWASTLDQADVKVMHERIAHGANLLESHVFQFDFLNDEFTSDKLPSDLLEVLNDDEKRRKLIIYINPPYAEAGNAKQRTGTGENKAGTAIGNRTYERYKNSIKKASNEVFAQFLIRIYKEIPNSKIANFSKLKNLQSSNFSDFRKEFRAKLEKIFLVPADTFDNVKGLFPISFQIWDGAKEEIFENIQADVYQRDKTFWRKKNIYLPHSYISKWIIKDKTNPTIGMMNSGRNDFQNQNLINIQIEITAEKSHALVINITKETLILSSIFFAVRWCIKADWHNDRDQFLYPKDGWQEDQDFQSNCLTYTLFHGQNRISCTRGTNHWIPFKEQEINAPERFASHFMTDFISGSLGQKESQEKAHNLFTLAGEENPHQTASFVPTQPLHFSPEAQAVFEAGKALWQYYFTQPLANANASLYDIREYFQGRNDKGKMNNKSTDETYNSLIGTLRQALSRLGQEIEPKVYEYQFLL